tara:strand:- start:1054 stop:1323 length:270 start_codon:yes stop_codon:yes gene_type:complete
MTQEDTPESLVLAFTDAPGRAAGPGCKTCAHPEVEKIDRAATAFAKMKQSGDTTHSWKDFRSHVLTPSYNYNLTIWSLRRHVKECLGHE